MDNRTTTDATFARFQAIEFYCETCRTTFKAKEIEEHFGRSHQAKYKCSYCEGPCYGYIDNLEIPRLWHRCPNS